MNQNLFELLERAFQAGGPDAGFELLIRTLAEQKSHALVFEARLMQKRHALGLPLIFTGTSADLPPETQGPYAAALADAAREAGHSYLADGDIVNAWTYFRAIGDPAPVAEAIDRVRSGEGIEAVLAIALLEGVSPRRGFELLLEHRGICDGIGFATHGSDRKTRLMFLQMLVRAFYNELATHLKEAITRVERQTPSASGVVELITGRDWLFANGGFYIESSHLVSILQASHDLEDLETMRLVVELADYGRRLDPVHQFPGEPPFENPYVDCAEYLHALLGEHVDQSLDHFRRKVADSVRGAAEVLVGLLARVGRYDEAIQISLEHLGGEAGSRCPSAMELCQQAGDYQRLCDVARMESDLLGFAAGMVQR